MKYAKNTITEGKCDEDHVAFGKYNEPNRYENGAWAFALHRNGNEKDPF